VLVNIALYIRCFRSDLKSLLEKLGHCSVNDADIEEAEASFHQRIKLGAPPL
jgi:hypothetical protein